MKNISLNKILTERSSEVTGRLAVASSANSVYFGRWELCNTELEGKSILLYFNDVVNLVKAMVALDGQASSVCPLSAGVRHDDLEHILTICDFDAVVTDTSNSHRNLFKRSNISVFSFDDIIERNLGSIISSITTEWLVPTSGTTSNPKLVKHTLNSLAASALSLEVDENTHEVWALFYDPTRYAGYQVLFRSLLTGQTLIAPSLSKSITQRVQICIDEKVTHISASATLWRRILMCQIANKIPLKQIVLGGEAADQMTLDALREAFPNAKITHVYASTEAGVAFSVSDGLAGFPLRYVDNQSTKIQEGLLYVAPQSAASSYVGEVKFVDLDGWVATGDLVAVDGERFYITGRASGVINVGGDKVVPETVRCRLLEHPEVLEAQVYGKKNPFTGMLLVVDVVLIKDAKPKNAEQSIRLFVKKHLPSTHQPKVIRFVNEINVNLTGKLEQRQ